MKFLKRPAKASVKAVEEFPAIGTIESPAYAWVGRNLLLAYEIAPVDGEGCALMLFRNASDVSISPLNAEGLTRNKKGPYVPEFNIQPWLINEINGDPKTETWKSLKSRRWVISFNDFTMDIVFEDVELIEQSAEIHDPDQMLFRNMRYLDNA